MVWSPSLTTWVVPCGSGGDDELATLLTFKKRQGGWARALITIIMGVGVQARNDGPWDTSFSLTLKCLKSSKRQSSICWSDGDDGVLSLVCVACFGGRKHCVHPNDYCLNFYLFIIFVDSAEENIFFLIIVEITISHKLKEIKFTFNVFLKILDVFWDSTTRFNTD